MTKKDFELIASSGPAPLTADMVDWQLECLPEDMPIRGNASAWGEPDDSEYAERIENELADGNQWAWCQVRLVGRYKGLTASDSLGGCSYASEEDFRQGGYYEDMRAVVLADLQKQLEDIRR